MYISIYKPKLKPVCKVLIFNNNSFLFLVETLFPYIDNRIDSSIIIATFVVGSE